MKYLSNLFVIVVVSFSLLGFYYEEQDAILHQPTQKEGVQIDIPENVQSVLDKSCLPCHGADGSKKAKMKWNYGKMPDYSKSKLISKLIKVSEKVDEGKMPPPKNLKKHPDRELSDDDKKILMDWADNTASGLAGGSE